MANLTFYARNTGINPPYLLDFSQTAPVSEGPWENIGAIWNGTGFGAGPAFQSTFLTYYNLLTGDQNTLAIKCGANCDGSRGYPATPTAQITHTGTLRHYGTGAVVAVTSGTTTGTGTSSISITFNPTALNLGSSDFFTLSFQATWTGGESPNAGTNLFVYTDTNTRWETVVQKVVSAIWTESNSISTSFDRLLTLIASVTFTNTINAAFGSTGSGYNSIYFCDISKGEPQWMVWGSEFSGTDIGVLEDANRKKILTIGSSSLIKRLLEVGQKSFVIGTGVIGRDYFGSPLTLSANQSAMFGNDNDDVWKHMSSLVLAVDNKLSGFSITLYLDGDTTHPITPQSLDLGNGFYRWWVNKYCRRMEIKLTFDTTDTPQSVRQAMLYWQPVGEVPYLKQI